MSLNSLVNVGKVILTSASIVLTTSVFSPVVGQTALNLSAQQLLAQQDDDIQEKKVVELPTFVKERILRNSSLQTGITVSNLLIVESEKKEWSNSCLELNMYGELCLNAVTNGWLVTIWSPEQLYIYHTNDDGSVIKLSKQASGVNP